ncbi:sulfite exporter TauE/SafE family protein [Mycobacterium sp.]|uniref:sulfite exporter TauE/SafE family protein n=1 Tax=Mycobacterium sp. TaxID=1785 RepID=UPI002BB16537|nr:sulfite exporter TauE/SafE family protein [Mycobacterium sp.]HTY31066.1 sulfite exporter TauE/SafE family protein [Mycobacterium sp.]
MVLIALAGFGAGAINALVGSGTLITFPTLVALGYPPVTATMSNAVGLVAGSVSGTWGYRAELAGQWNRLRWQLPASLAGAVLGAFLLLHLPAKVFIEIVPVLLVLALVLVVIGPKLQSWAARRAEVGVPPACGGAGRSPEHVTPARMAVLVLGTFAVGVYGGYFTAAQGILLVGIMGALLPESVQRMNAAKNLLTLVVNVVAAVSYSLVAFHRISWPVAGLIAAGSLLGGVVGARYGRRLSPTALRSTIVVVGLIGLYRLLSVA